MLKSVSSSLNLVHALDHVSSWNLSQFKTMRGRFSIDNARGQVYDLFENEMNEPL